MFFKNMLVYKITHDIDLSAERLQTALDGHRAKPCADSAMGSFGFIAPIGKHADAPLVHASSGCLLLQTREEERIIPGSVISEYLADKVQEIEVRDGRKVYKKEKDQLKDEIIQSLMPRAFIKKTTLQAAIDTTTGLIYINCSAHKKAEQLLNTLREALGSLPVRPLTTTGRPDMVFTYWLRSGCADNNLSLQDECELTDAASDGMIKIKRFDLTSEDIANLLSSGKIATALSLNWNGKVSFQLNSKYQITRLKFDDLLAQQASQDSNGNAEAEQDATFTLMMLTLREMTADLTQALGGEETVQTV